MKILDTEKKGPKVVSDHFSVHAFHFPDDVKHFLTVDILHDKINIFFIVEGFDKANDVGKDDFLKNLFLCYHAFF